MSRFTLYELVEKYELDPTEAFGRLMYFFTQKKYDARFDYMLIKYTIYNFINKYVFKYMPVREYRTSLTDLFKDLHLSFDGQKSIDDLILLMEVIMCAIDNTPQRILSHATYEDRSNIYSEIIAAMNSIVDKIGHRIAEVNNSRIIVPIDCRIEQAIILSNDERLAINLLSYNHHSNRGDLRKKKMILDDIYQALEPDIKTMRGNKGDHRHKDAVLIDDLANNFHIRHNNLDGDNERKYIKQLSEDELEAWYDRIFNAFVYFIIMEDFSKTKMLASELKKETD